MPFVIRWPGVIPAGLRLDTPLSTVDVVPTILSLLGAPVAGGMQGWNLSAAALGASAAGPGSVFLMGSFPNQGEVWRGVRTGRFTFGAREVAGHLDPRLLYDNAADPFQLENRVGLPRSAALPGELEAELAARFGLPETPGPRGG